MNLDAYLTRADAALIAGVKPETLSKWRARGWVTADNARRDLTTRPGKGGTLEYRLGDVLDAARDTAANPRNPGRETRVLVLA